MTLPFLEPDNEIYVNLGIVMIIVASLSVTQRGKLTLNNEKLHIFMYLVKNPVVLNKVLNIQGKDSMILKQRDSYSLNTISPNLDTLFDRELMKALITILVAKKLLQVEYKKNEGFFYTLNEIGREIANNLQNDFFAEIWFYCKKMSALQSLSESKLNQSLNQIMKKEG